MLVSLIRKAARITAALSLLLPAIPVHAENRTAANPAGHQSGHGHDRMGNADPVQLGPRPFFLVQDMDASPLREQLESCSKGPFYRTDFSIGHRGAAMQFPEHTEESYRAAARMGAGIVECDVTFTRDRELVCRHSQCDLHTTTNILDTPLAAKCSQPFTPADPAVGSKAKARCCTSDITLAEFKSLNGKMDASDPNAATVAQYLGGTAAWRTDLYASRGTLLTHKESIALFTELGVKMTPELKTPSVDMPFQGTYTQANYAQQLVDEIREAGVAPENVWPQSFLFDDIAYWIANEPDYARQAVYLDARGDRVFNRLDPDNPATFNPDMNALVDAGLKIIAPPTWVLLTVDSDGRIVPSEYAKQARKAGLGIITWSLERSPPLATGGGYYYQSVKEAIDNDGDQMTVMHVLAHDVGVMGIFSDWPATTTFYANCMNLR